MTQGTKEQFMREITSPQTPIILKNQRHLTYDESAMLFSELEKHGFHLVSIDFQIVPDYEMFLINQLNQGFSFPDYFGQNWNAVDECLGDLSWLSAKGYCCLLINAQKLQILDQRVFELFLDVFQCAGEIWRKDGIPFKLLIFNS